VGIVDPLLQNGLLDLLDEALQAMSTGVLEAITSIMYGAIK